MLEAQVLVHKLVDIKMNQTFQNPILQLDSNSAIIGDQMNFLVSLNLLDMNRLVYAIGYFCTLPIIKFKKCN